MPADSPMVLVPRSWLESFDREANPNEAIADNGGSVWDFFCYEAERFLSASPARGEGDLGSSASPIPSDGLSGAAAAALRPCPFSGHTDSDEGPTQESGLSVERFKSPAGGFAYRVACCCGVRGRSERERGDAIHAWNVRATPSPGEGDAPVAWRVVSPSGEEHGLFYHHGEAKANAQPGDTVKPLYGRPTTATPEGLREKVMQAVLLGGDAWAITDAILAALQPQAEGGEG